MNYSFHQLRIFTEVVKHKSISKAADKLRMTQPALSIQLKNFQENFEFPLYLKKGRGIQISEYGFKIEKLANEVLQKAQEITYLTKAYKNLEAGELKIVSASTGKYVIPYLVQGFLKKYPNIDLKIEISNKEDVVNQLKEDEVDFALISVIPEDLAVHEEVLFENKLYLVGKTPKYNSKVPLIYREPGSATRKAMDEYFRKEQRKKSFELSTNEAVKQAVMAGLGYSILPNIGIADEIRRGELHIVEQAGLPIVTHWRIVYNRSKKQSPLAKAFLDYLVKHKQELIQRFLH
jgi:DNA-binding transcriptional LysR family regulator